MPPEFEQMIKANSGRISAIARRYADAEEQDDLYQEILEQLWRSFKQFRGEAKPETWIYRIGFNTAMTRVRKAVKQRQGREQMSALRQQESAPSGRCQAEVLQEFLQSLSEVDASILMMYLDGLSGDDMAVVLGMKTNAIQVRINRIKKQFAERYVSEEGE